MPETRNKKNPETPKESKQISKEANKDQASEAKKYGEKIFQSSKIQIKKFKEKLEQEKPMNFEEFKKFTISLELKINDLRKTLKLIPLQPSKPEYIAADKKTNNPFATHFVTIRNQILLDTKIQNQNLYFDKKYYANEKDYKIAESTNAILSLDFDKAKKIVGGDFETSLSILGDIRNTFYKFYDTGRKSQSLYNSNTISFNKLANNLQKLSATDGIDRHMNEISYKVRQIGKDLINNKETIRLLEEQKNEHKKYFQFLLDYHADTQKITVKELLNGMTPEEFLEKYLPDPSSEIKDGPTPLNKIIKEQPAVYEYIFNIRKDIQNCDKQINADKKSISELEKIKKTAIENFNKLIDRIAKSYGKTRKELLNGMTPEEFLEKYYPELKQPKSPFSQFHPEKLGVCRDFGVFLAYLAYRMGHKNTFALGGIRKGSMHVENGGMTPDGRYYIIAENNSFIGFKDLTATLDFYEALINKAPSFAQYITLGEKLGKGMIPIVPETAKKMRQFARGGKGNLLERTKKNAKNETIRLPNGLSASVNEEGTNIEAAKTTETFHGTSILRFDYFKNRNDMLNLIKKAVSVHGGHQTEGVLPWGTEWGVKTGVTYAAGDLKTKMENGDPITFKELLAQFNPNIAGGAEISDMMHYSYALGFEGLLAYNLGKGAPAVSGKMSSAQRLSLITGNMEAYAQAETDSSLVFKNMTDTSFWKLALYNDLIGGRLGLGFKGKRFSLEGDIGYGTQGGIDHHADIITANMKTKIDNSYFLNLNFEHRHPKIFFVNPLTKGQAELGKRFGIGPVPCIMTLYGAYAKKSNDPTFKPEYRFGAGAQFVLDPQEWLK